jgi:hypothetical protein
MNKLQFLLLVTLFLTSSCLYAGIELKIKTAEVQYFVDDLMKLEIEKIIVNEQNGFRGDI